MISAYIMGVYQKHVFSKSIKNVFATLDEYDYHILETFAKTGECRKYAINLGMSGRQIARKVEILENKGFVHVTKKVQYKNIKKNTKGEKRYTRIFGLTSKGFIASLRTKNIKINYLTKNLLDNIENQELKNITLDYIKSDLSYFLKHNELRGMILDNIKDISSWFNEYDNHFGFSKESKMILDDMKKYKETQSNILNQKIKSIYDDKKSNSINNYLKKWHSSINSLSHKQNFKEIAKKYSKEKPYKKSLSGSQVMEISDMITEGIHIKTYAEYEKY